MALAYERSGSGPPLVLVHGLGHHRGGWAPVRDQLARERDVIAVDLPGFGESPPLPDGTRATVEELADAVAQTTAELGLDRPHLAGNSLGGGIALELGRRGLARSVTAISPTGFWCSRRERAFASGSLTLTRNASRVIGGVAPVLAATGVGRTMLMSQVFGRPWRLPPEAVVADVRNMGSCPGFENARDNVIDWMYPNDAPASLPITIAWGTRDWLLIPRQGRRAERTVPGARMVWLKGLGHTPMWDDPPQVARVLLEGSAAA
jgi:pimeloyl-ACP methyl ester carboxylesterase